MGQGGDVLAVDFDQSKRRAGPRALTAACTALTSELLPMPRAPQSSALLAGRPCGEAARVLEQDVARAIDALEQVDRHAVDVLDRLAARRARACQT